MRLTGRASVSSFLTLLLNVAQYGLAVVIVIASALTVLSRDAEEHCRNHDGQPFVAANAARIRSIALIVIFGELARTALLFAANVYAITHFSASGLQFDAQPDLNIFAIIHGLIILVIAEVFRTGTRLDEDQSLTI